MVQVETDVLIVGGGLAGCWAAIAAAQAGGRVMLVEKGYAGTSGVAATAGPGHWWVPPDAALRAEAVEKRLAGALGLGERVWMERILEQTWRILPTLARYYTFGTDALGHVQYQALRGPEYLRGLRQYALDLGVQIHDHAPALELLRRADGSIAGAAGVQLQAGDAWQVRSGAVVLATGGCAFRSHLLGSANNTGDGHLMAAEAGAFFSGMEFSSYYTVAPAGTTMTRSMSYAFATYYDEAGTALDVPFGESGTVALARALLRGRVFCDLSRMPQDVRARLPHISPNVTLPFTRRGIDPFRDRFEITLRAEGTVRGVGGVIIAGPACETQVAGLFAAGDVASREAVTGAVSGGGAVNSAWALSSAWFAGEGAVRFAQRAARDGPAEPIGQAGLRPLAAADDNREASAMVQAVRAEMLPLDRHFFRTGALLSASAGRLDGLWRYARAHLGGTPAPAPVPVLRAREAASLIAVARWCTAAASARQESRGMHRRLDHPTLSPGPVARITTGGLDECWAAHAKSLAA